MDNKNKNIILLALAGLGIWYFLKKSSNTNNSVITTDKKTAVEPEVSNPVYMDNITEPVYIAPEPVYIPAPVVTYDPLLKILDPISDFIYLPKADEPIRTDIDRIKTEVEPDVSYPVYVAPEPVYIAPEPVYNNQGGGQFFELIEERQETDPDFGKMDINEGLYF